MISISLGLLGGVETAAASVGKKDKDGPPFADTFEQAAASGRTKVAARGAQGGVKIDRGTAQAKKAGRSTQNDVAVKQADGGVAAAKDDAGAEGAKGGVTGKKIATVTDAVQELVAGGPGDGEDFQASVARAVPEGSAQVGKGRVVVVAKDGTGSLPEAGGTAVEVAGLSKEATVSATGPAGAFQSGVQRTIGASHDGSGRTFGSSAVAQEQAPVASGDGAIGASIRPDLKGAVDVVDAGLPGAAVRGLDLTSVASPVATVQGLGSVAVMAPAVAERNGSEPIARSLTKVVDEGVLPGREVEASPIELEAVAFVPAQTLKSESFGVAASSFPLEGVSLSKTIVQTRQIVAGDAVGDRFPDVAQSAGGAKNLVDGVTAQVGRVTSATSSLESPVRESATAQKPVVEAVAGGSSPLTGFGAAQRVPATSVADAPRPVVAGVVTGNKPGAASFVGTEVPAAIESGAEGIAAKVGGGLSAGSGSTQALPIASEKSDVLASVAQPSIAADIQPRKNPNGLPQVAADESGVAALKGAVAKVVQQPVATHQTGSGPDGSKTTAKSAGRNGETERTKATSEPATGGGKVVVETGALGLVAPAVVAASVVPVASAPAATPLVVSDAGVSEGGRGVTPLAGPVVGATFGLQGDPVAGVESVSLAASATETVASGAPGSHVVKSSTGQAAEIPAGPALVNAGLTDAVQGLEARIQRNAPVEASGVVAPVVAGGGEVAAIGPVKAGQDRKAIGGAGTVGGRERKTVSAESRAGDVAASAGVADAGRGVAVASPVDAGVAAVKPIAAEHRAPVSEGGQVSAAPVASVDGAAVQAHVASAVPAIVPAAAPLPSSNGTAEPSVGGTHSASAAGSAGDSLVSPMAHTTLQATPTVLEVGIPGGTHGWLKIRAEIGEGGTVQASMSASSHAGQDALRRDLPAMNAFLESEHVPVSLQVTHGTGSSWVDKDGAMTQGGSSLGAGLGSGLGQGAGQDGQGAGREAGAMADAGQGGGRQQGAGSGSQNGVVGEPGNRGGVVPQSSVEGEAAWTAAPGYGSGVRGNGGSWLNVMA